MPGIGSGYRWPRTSQQGLQAGVIGPQAVRLELHDMPALAERPGIGKAGDLIDGYLHLALVRHPVVGVGSALWPHFALARGSDIVDARKEPYEGAVDDKMPP